MPLSLQSAFEIKIYYQKMAITIQRAPPITFPKYKRSLKRTSTAEREYDKTKE
jgi:hypothetical protein